MDSIKTYNALLGHIREFQELRGRILCRAERTGDELRLYLTDDHYVRFHHQQDCCESVWIEDICGDLNDLVGEPLLEAEEVQGDGPVQDYESYTWTFYRFGTRRGSVTVRWLGHSNGYYGEGVDVEIMGSAREE
jgi:hypothetical protein